ncbi:FAD-binding oxidoreductase [Frondihabitans peucedani]|uniref:FAD-binding oxidoreductase n=1 Tax=Frondihabitans peucedani TaxID=598626 RepID=A0ABP8DYW2_9MICO
MPLDTSGPSRRTFVTGLAGLGALAGVGTLALAGCTTRAPSPAASTTPAADRGPSTWAALAAAATGTLLRPSSVGYGTAKLTENPRFDDAAPLGILLASSAADVAAGLAFARNSKTPLAVRSGGHNYAGWSAGGASGTDVSPSLVIDTAGLRSITLSDDGSTVDIGPGAPLALVYETLGARGRAIGAGSCGTVAVGGLTLGGGVGVLSRSFGLTCDQLTGVEIVTADGVVHQASAAKDADLFWACRGGGGGSVGVVTRLTFQTQAAPTVDMWALTFPWSAAADVVAAWQQWAPTADERLWSTLKLLGGETHPRGPVVTVSGTWTGDGPVSAQLSAFLTSVGTAPLTSVATSHDYVDAMLRYAGCAGQKASACTTGDGGVLKRVSESGASSLPTVALSADGIQTLLAKVEAAQDVVGLTEGGISLDALGGAVSRVAAGDTAFVHRDAILSAQYTSTFADGVDPSSFDAYVRSFREALVPEWGEASYVNYVDASLASPGESYFGANLSRMQSIRKATDAASVFRQPHFL